ncbi:MAG: radical SAM protein [Polyangiaceae bacterium]|jgi:radical SAM protein with 4Fe4S-binding SPASM domain|nr:radical SAM protein [Polyangiaceae bacterium]MBK8940027.1 radical SAM protein [Polyangiaceae bacterium]
MLMVSDLVRLAMGEAPERATALESPLRYARGPRERGDLSGTVVVWNICRHCNMTCPHCYVAAGTKPSPGDLDTSACLRVIDQLAGAGVTTLIVSGGEPLLRADVFELIAHARGRGLSVQLSTNGVLIDEGVAARLAGLGVSYVGISIDGPRELNDAYRGLEGGFDLAVQALAHLRAAGLRTGLRTTLTRKNLDALAPMLALAAERADRFYVSHLVYAGRGLRMMGDDLTREQTRASLTWLFERAVELASERHPLRIVTGGNDSAGGLFVRFTARRFGEPAAAKVRAMLERRAGNSAGEKLLNIDHKGGVHPDQFWQSERLGRLPLQPLAEVLDHPLLGELRTREERLTGRCAGCSDRALCRGSHRERAEAAYGDRWAPDPSCVLSDEEIGASAPTRHPGAHHVQA